MADAIGAPNSKNASLTRYCCIHQKHHEGAMFATKNAGLPRDRVRLFMDKMTALQHLRMASSHQSQVTSRSYARHSSIDTSLALLPHQSSALCCKGESRMMTAWRWMTWTLVQSTSKVMIAMRLELCLRDVGAGVVIGTASVVFGAVVVDGGVKEVMGGASVVAAPGQQ